MNKSKKAGCTDYADVSNDYMLYDKAVTKTGGVKRKSKKAGGTTFMDQLANNASKLLSAYAKNGGCDDCVKKGGSIELAPFAAALAFLATRFATDANFKLPKSTTNKKTTTTSKKTTTTSKKTI